MSYPDHFLSAAALRKEAERHDKLAAAARRDGDWGDVTACEARATELRRLARRKEAEGEP